MDAYLFQAPISLSYINAMKEVLLHTAVRDLIHDICMAKWPLY